MTFFCPACWAEVSAALGDCPRCGVDMDRYARSTRYVEKLISALRHPEPQTVRRAAWILGRLRAREAVAALLCVGEQERDPYVVESVVEALGEIGDERARAFLQRCAAHGAVRVRRAARGALARLAAGAGDHAH